MADLGIDLSCATDLERSMRTVSGQRALAQALLRRLQTPRGGLFCDEDYGFDLRELVNTGFEARDLFRFRVAIEAELEKDPRVAAARATLTPDGTGGLRLALQVESAEGPFDLVLSVSALSVELLTPSA